MELGLGPLPCFIGVWKQGFGTFEGGVFLGVQIPPFPGHKQLFPAFGTSGSPVGRANLSYFSANEFLGEIPPSSFYPAFRPIADSVPGLPNISTPKGINVHPMWDFMAHTHYSLAGYTCQHVSMSIVHGEYWLQSEYTQSVSVTMTRTAVPVTRKPGQS